MTQDTPSDATDAANLDVWEMLQKFGYAVSKGDEMKSSLMQIQLCDLYERQAAELAALREHVRRMRTVLLLFAPEPTGHIGSVCSACHMFVQSDIGHTEACKIGQARLLLAEGEA